MFPPPYLSTISTRISPAPNLARRTRHTKTSYNRPSTKIKSKHTKNQNPTTQTSLRKRYSAIVASYHKTIPCATAARARLDRRYARLFHGDGAGTEIEAQESSNVLNDGEEMSMSSDCDCGCDCDSASDSEICCVSASEASEGTEFEEDGMGFGYCSAGDGDVVAGYEDVDHYDADDEAMSGEEPRYYESGGDGDADLSTLFLSSPSSSSSDDGGDNDSDDTEENNRDIVRLADWLRRRKMQKVYGDVEHRAHIQPKITTTRTHIQCIQPMAGASAASHAGPSGTYRNPLKRNDTTAAKDQNAEYEMGMDPDMEYISQSSTRAKSRSLSHTRTRKRRREGGFWV